MKVRLHTIITQTIIKTKLLLYMCACLITIGSQYLIFYSQKCEIPKNALFTMTIAL